MEILLLCNKMPYPLKDGGAIATYMITEGLARFDNRITILAMNTKKHLIDIKRAQQETKNIATLIDHKINTNTNLFHIIINLLLSKQPYNAVRFRSNNYRKKIITLLKTQSFDIIQLESVYLSPYLPLIREYSKAKIGLRAHNVEYKIWDSIAQNQKSILKKLYLKILTKRIKNFEIKAIPNFDYIVPISPIDAELIKNINENIPTVVIPTGINLDEVEFAKNTNDLQSLFFIGALDWIPNQNGLLWFIDNVFANIVTRFPNLKLHIAGRNAPGWLIKKLCKKNIIFWGEVEESADFMKNKSVMIVPLFSGSGIRIKILEAMSRGKAIISTPIGIQGISSTHGTNIIIADSIEQFIQEIEELLTNKTKLNYIKKNAFSFVQNNYNNTVLCKQLNDFYKKHLI